MYVFGSPTATMVRSEIVRQKPDFYNVSSAAADVDICFDILKDWDFGFVHQVLSYTRRDNESLISTYRTFHLMLLSEFLNIHKYGPIFLTAEENKKRTAELRRQYLLMLGESLLRRREKAFWEFHKSGLAVAGLDLRWRSIWCYGILAALKLILNPLDTSVRLSRLYIKRNNPVES
jgi:hypothetical protein